MSGANTFRSGCIAAALAALTLLVFAPSLSNGFVWEDSLNLLENTGWRGFSPRFWFISSVGGDFKPLVWASYSLDYALWGLNPFGYHLSNLLLHALNAVLVYFLLLKIGGGAVVPSAAGLAALFFAVHPLRVESVAWITERKDVLFALFYLLAILCYLRFIKRRPRRDAFPAYNAQRRVGAPACNAEPRTVTDGVCNSDDPGEACRGDSCDRSKTAGRGANTRLAPTTGRTTTSWAWYWAAFGFALLSLLSKPMAVSLPAVLLLLDFALPALRRKKSASRLIAEKAPFLLAVLVVSVVTLRTQAERGALASVENLSVAGRISLIGYSGIFYPGKILWPARLGPLYPTDSGWGHFGPSSSVYPVLLALLAVGGLLFGMKGHRWLLLASGWYLITWFPISGVFRTGLVALADRFAYLPSIGVSIFLVYYFSRCAGKIRMIVLSAAAAIVLILMGLTERQIGIWRDSLTLWTRGAEFGAAAAHYNLGNALQSSSDLEGAIARYQQAIRICPDYADAHYNLALALGRRGRTEESVTHYREAIRIAPESVKAHNNLGSELAGAGDVKGAMKEFSEVLKLDPLHADANSNLANLLAAEGRYGEAVEHYRRAIRSNPGLADAHYNLGVTLALQGKKEEALECYRRALEIDPKHERSRHNLSLIELSEKKLE